MWSDNETERDFVNFTSVADTVSEIIVQADGEPVSIGISGAWGTGKSSMIKLIKRSIDQKDSCDNESDKKFILVDFNAWLYQGYDDARAALIDVVASALQEEAKKRETGVEKVKELAKRVNWLRVARLTAGSTVALTLGLPPTGLIGEVFNLGKKVAGGSGSTIEGSEVESAVGGVSESADSLFKPPPDFSPPKEIQAIRDLFEQSLEEMNVTLIVLIDDLDRCLPATAISTLEAIRLLLFLKRTAFVIAADNEMIKYAVKKHFEGVDDNLVTSYFDKLIQVPIRVPQLGTHEVRAYMLLLFVEDSTLEKDQKEEIRTKVCEQLSQSWQGKRVDKAFIESIGITFSSELTARLETADRLAPIMTIASGIAGNPRLIKRFLNALSIRMSIAKGHGVSIDEAHLVKMLLFERCGNQKAYAELTKAVNEDGEGKPHFLKDLELSITSGEEMSLSENWQKDIEFIKEWLALPPQMADIDLRGILYVCRDHEQYIAPEDRLTSDGAELVNLLLEHPDMASQLKDRLEQLQLSDSTIIMDKLLEKARQEQEWGTPPLLDACLAMAEADAIQGKRLAAFLIERPSTQITPSIIPKIQDQGWADEVFDKWASSSVRASVKKAIKQRKE